MIGLVLVVVVGSGPGKHGKSTSQTVSQEKFAHFPLDEGRSAVHTAHKDCEGFP